MMTSRTAGNVVFAFAEDVVSGEDIIKRNSLQTISKTNIAFVLHIIYSNLLELLFLQIGQS